jgi:hypothetical protein
MLLMLLLNVQHQAIMAPDRLFTQARTDALVALYITLHYSVLGGLLMLFMYTYPIFCFNDA